MNHTPIIICREVRTRLRRPAFWIVPAAAALLVVALYALPFVMTDRSQRQQTVLVVDETGLFDHSFVSTERTAYRDVGSLESARRQLGSGRDIVAIIYIPARDVAIPRDAVLLYRTTPPTAALQAAVANQLQNILRSNILLDAYDISADDYHMLMSTHIQLRTQDIESGREAHLAVRTAVGTTLAALAVLAVLLLSGAVLRGVAEERHSRIAEIMVASTNCRQLLVGKMAGIGLAGLLQFALATTLATGGIVATSALGADRMAQAQAAVPILNTKGAEAVAQLDNAVPATPTQELLQSLAAIDFPLLAAMLLLFTLLGYTAYAAASAAIAASQSDSSQASTWHTIMVIPLVATLLMAPLLAAQPKGALAVALSLFPPTAPAAMLMRLPFGIPLWQVGLSLLLLTATGIGLTLVAATAYRKNLVGGKK